MENTTKRIHPLVAGAAVSVIVASLTGVAAITGVLPNSHSTAAPAATPAPSAALVAPEPEPATIAASAASRAAAAAVDQKYAMAVEEAPAKPAAQPQLARPKPVTTTARASAPVYAPPAAPASYPVVTTPAPVYTPPPPVAQARTCYDCGRVESVRVVATQAAPSGIGVVGGAVLGGLLGNQVGGGNGRALATVAGAVGGGYAGNEVEKRTRVETTYQVRVRMEGGNVRTFPYNNQPNWNVGDRVRVVDGYLRAAT